MLYRLQTATALWTIHGFSFLEAFFISVILFRFSSRYCLYFSLFLIWSITCFLTYFWFSTNQYLFHFSHYSCFWTSFSSSSLRVRLNWQIAKLVSYHITDQVLSISTHLWRVISCVNSNNNNNNKVQRPVIWLIKTNASPAKATPSCGTALKLN